LVTRSARYSCSEGEAAAVWNCVQALLCSLLSVWRWTNLMEIRFVVVAANGVEKKGDLS